MFLTERDIIIDVETRCDADIKTEGAFRYCWHPTFQVVLISCMFGNAENGVENVYTFDVINGEQAPQWFVDILFDPRFRKHAHNAVFEILSLQRYFNCQLDVSQWYCSMACVAFCGLPLGLEDSANALNHKWKKKTTGTALINKFSKPRKDGIYNDPRNYPQEWATFIEYNKFDVLAEKANLECLPEIPELFNDGKERKMWLLDFAINYAGVGINVQLAKNADKLCEMEDAEMLRDFKVDGLNNPNSNKQVLEFLRARGYQCETLRADDYDKYLTMAEKDEIVKSVLEIKKNLSLTSATKFKKFIDTEIGGRIYGTLQYYGANRTGRWGGRGAQPQNLKRNDMPFEELSLLRQLVLNGDYEGVKMLFGSVKANIVELCRTVVEPAAGNVFESTDFSAIEARVTAWIANEKWRLDVFRSHGKIYEASAAMMFKKKVEDIKKGSMERMKGKYAELALGFSGWVGAFKRFGADKFMTEEEMKDVANLWRKSSPKVVELWTNIETAALSAVKDFGEPYETSFGAVYQGIEYNDRKWLTCKLPSGRRLFYYDPQLKISSRNTYTFSYRRNANEQDTWRGILTENVVQAIARDLLVEKLIYVYDNYGVLPVLHVHDELVYEFPDQYKNEWKQVLDNVMSMEIDWAKGLPLKGDTSILPFYMKE